MLITRKTKVPLHWVFYAQIPFVMTIAGSMVTQAPLLYAMKKFIDNPAAITFLLSIEVFVTMLGGPFASWLSDRIWTKHGRRKPFIVISEIGKAAAIAAMPFAPNLMWLISLRWIYGIVGDIGTPNQALTMEVVPAKQRGVGAGFFKFQQQIVNLLFFGLVLGRFDDVIFTGPFYDLIAVPGETLIFLAGAILFLSVGFFTWFGVHEVEPPSRQRIADDRRPGESLVRLFLRGFFRDVFHKSLLPLYLLMMVGTLTSVSLGTLEPLLYTDQWGYSLQEMGTNIAIGAIVGVGAALLAGWAADKTSKMKVYTVGLVLMLLSRIAWTLFVAHKPDQRPELHEIVLFGTLGNIFGLIAGAASFPLILEYVERNRLGTAGAGMGLFSATIRNGFMMFVGFYVLAWSLFFLPQAGDRVQLVFKDERPASAILAKLDAAGYPAHALDLEPMHRPGIDGETSRHWKIRRPIENAGDLHKQVKELNTEIASLLLKLQRPGVSPDTQTALRAEVATARDEQKKFTDQLAASAQAFEADLTRIFVDDLAPDGRQILAARSEEGGTRVSLTMEFVEPVTTDVTRRSFLQTLGIGKGSTERLTVTGEFTRVLETVDLNRVARDGSNDHAPELTAEPAPGPLHAIAFTLHRDPDFVLLENALAAAGAEAGAAYNLASNLILPIRGLSGENTGAYAVADVRASRESLAFALTLAAPRFGEPATAAAVKDALRLAPGVRGLTVVGEFPRFQVNLDLAPLPEAAPETITPVGKRLRELLPSARPEELRALETIARRATETAAAGPVFLTAARPVVLAQPADREYDYFFSMQYFMICTDILGIGLVGFIVYLEKRGVVSRLGAREDENR